VLSFSAELSKLAAASMIGKNSGHRPSTTLFKRKSSYERVRRCCNSSFIALQNMTTNILETYKVLTERFA